MSDTSKDCTPSLQPTITFAASKVAGKSAADANSTNSVDASATEGTQIEFHESRKGTRFEVLRSHAKGGLGEVFVARDIELNREVALKEIQSRFADDQESRLRFVLEAEVTGCLEHPGIVPVYGLGQYADGRPYYAMRFIRGNSLQEAIDRFHCVADSNLQHGDKSHHTLSVAPAFDSVEFRKLMVRFISVCNAIEYAHSRGVLHRDIKPGNIMLGNYGETLVVDWGLAKVQGWDERQAPLDEQWLQPRSSGGSTATEAHRVLGTPAFMSPEQAAGRLDQVGPVSDVYSLGATLYTLLTGQIPFAKSKKSEVLSRVQSGDFPRPRQACPRVPLPLEAICLKAMALHPADRCPSPLALANEIERWLADEPVSAYREPWAARLGRWSRRYRTAVVSAIVFLASAVVALSLSTALIWAEQRKTEKQRQVAEGNYSEAQGLSFDTLALVEALEANIVNEPSLHATRKRVLTAAARVFRQSLDRHDAGPETRRRAAQVFRYAANVHRLDNELDQAGPLYREAIEIMQGLTAQDTDAATRLKLANILRDEATLLSRRGQDKGAAQNLREVVRIAEDLEKQDPNQTAFPRCRAIALVDLSAVTFSQGQTDDARQAAEEALRLFVELAKRPTMAHPYDPVMRAMALNRLAIIERQSGQLEKARQRHSAATKILEALRASPPQKVALVDIQHMLAQCRYEQGKTMTLVQEVRSIGEQDLEGAAKQWAILAKNYPTVAQHRKFQAAAKLALGDVRSEDRRPMETDEEFTKRLQAAVGDFKTAQELLEKLTTDHPGISTYHAELGRAYAGLARVARLQGEEATATDWLQRAAKSRDMAAKLSPDNAGD